MEDKWTKYFQNELTDSEKQELFSRINTDRELKNDFARLNNIWGVSQLLEQKQDAETARAGRQRLYNTMSRKKNRSLLLSVLKYAAIICLVFTVSRYFTKNYPADHNTIYTEIHVPSGQRLHITLADGSSVWLSPQSHLKLPNEFSRDNRTVELDGEGFFDVVKDSERPFIVKSKGYNIEVIGTQFNLFSYSKNPRYEAHLIEGKVQAYSDPDKKDAIMLSSNEKVSLIDGRLVKSVSYYDNKDFITSGIYNFHATQFIDILEYLALWYDVGFDIKGEVMLTTRVNAKFRLNDDIENILTALQNVFQFNFKRPANTNKIEISK